MGPKLVREFVREVLKEDDYGSIMAGDQFANYGAHYGSGSDLYNVFIKPFTDVVKTAAGKTKELSQKAQTLVKVSFEALATSLVPALSDSYAEIFADEKEKIDQIKSEYAEVYNSTWDTFRENDVLVAAFLYRPDLFLTATLAKKAPQATAKLLSVLSGGTLDKVLNKFKVTRPAGKPNISGGGSGDGNYGGFGGGGFGESIVRENKGDGPEDKLVKLVQHKKVKDVLAKSQKTQEMSRLGQQLTRNTLKRVFEQAQGVLSAKSIDDVIKATGANVKGVEELKKVPEQERQKAEQVILAGVKKSMKEFYVKSLEAQLKQALDAGTPSEHPFVNDYRNVIQKIKAL